MEPRLAVTQGGQEDSPVQGAQHWTSRRPGTTAPHRGLGCGAYHLGLTLGPPLVVTVADLTSLSLHSSVIWNLRGMSLTSQGWWDWEAARRDCTQ